MPISKEQFAIRFQARFAKQNGQPMPDAWLSWCYAAFCSGFRAGEEHFSNTHDWYEVNPFI